MLPEDTYSSLAVGAAFVLPDSNVSSPLMDYERGGVAINDPSQGLDVQDWRCYLAPNRVDVMLQPGASPAVMVFSQAGIDALSFTFDQNMRPCVAYAVGENCYLRWFDSVPGEYVTTPFVGVRNPRVALDDKRITQFASNSDIIFAYIRGDSLYYRQQRDRFTIERLLRSGISPNLRLKNIGMSHVLRMQFELA